MSQSSGGSVIDLVAKSGRSVPMPDANSGIRSIMLYRDERTRARTLTVEFPPGFSRQEPGRYPAAEELLVLSGELDLAGVHVRAGDWGWLPHGILRRGMSSSSGAVVYAWFSDTPDWERSNEDLAGPPARTERVGGANATARQLRGVGAVGDEPGCSAIVAPGDEVVGPAELLDLASYSWTYLKSGERQKAGPAPAFVRWPGRVSGLA
jgi:hypothetical protein